MNVDGTCADQSTGDLYTVVFVTKKTATGHEFRWPRVTDMGGDICEVSGVRREYEGGFTVYDVETGRTVLVLELISTLV